MESSSFGRLFGVLFAPGKTFRSIVERPTWLVPLLVLALVSAAVGFVAGQRTDYRDMMIQGARDKGQDVNEAQMEPAIEMMEKAGPAIAAVTTPMVLVLFSLIGAFLYWMVFKLLGSDFSYKSSLAVSQYASVPLIISMLLSIPVILSRPTITYADMKQSGGSYLQSSLAFLAPEGAPAWLITLYACVDFFAIWSLALSVIGFRALSNKPTRSVAIVVIVIWLIFVGIRVGLASLS